MSFLSFSTDFGAVLLQITFSLRKGDSFDKVGASGDSKTRKNPWPTGYFSAEVQSAYSTALVDSADDKILG